MEKYIYISLCVNKIAHPQYIFTPQLNLMGSFRTIDYSIEMRNSMENDSDSFPAFINSATSSRNGKSNSLPGLLFNSPSILTVFVGGYTDGVGPVYTDSGVGVHPNQVSTQVLKTRQTITHRSRNQQVPGATPSNQPSPQHKPIHHMDTGCPLKPQEISLQ